MGMVTYARLDSKLKLRNCTGHRWYIEGDIPTLLVLIRTELINNRVCTPDSVKMDLSQTPLRNGGLAAHS